MDVPLPYCVVAGEVSQEQADAICEDIRLKTLGHSQPDELNDESSSSSLPKWDCLVLTAMNEQQKRIFDLQLADLPWRQYAEKCVVVQDPLGIRDGSDGATVWVLKENREHNYIDSDSKVLLIHPGGYSQRTPHLSHVGKIFMSTPDETSFLDGN